MASYGTWPGRPAPDTTGLAGATALAGDRRGASSLEYAVIAALLVGVVASGFSSLGTALTAPLQNLADTLAGTTTTTTTDSGGVASDPNASPTPTPPPWHHGDRD